MKVLICCPNWRHLGLECHRGLLQIAAAAVPHETDPGEGWGIGSVLWGGVNYEVDFIYTAQTNIPFAREFLVDAAIERKADVSVHVDSDTGFELEHVFGLVELLGTRCGTDEDGDPPIVCAASPVALRHPPHNVAAFPMPITNTHPADWWQAQPDVVPVAATGMGLVAFLMDVLVEDDEIQRPYFPVFDNRWPEARIVDDLPPWLTNPQAKMVGSDVAFTARLAQLWRVVIDNRPKERPVRHVVETSIAPFETTTLEGSVRHGGPGAGRKTV